MTYQFPAAAWRPGTKPAAGSPTPDTITEQADFAATIAEALIATPGGVKRRPNPRTAAEMLGQLEAQAREIVELAAEARSVASFRTFTAYRRFREKLADFQTFCGIIETYLGRLASDRRDELEAGFYALWGAIYRPALKALDGFFTTLERDGVMPLGAREILEAEMLALESMCGLMADPRFSEQNAELIAQTQAMVQRVGALADRASSLPELVDTRAA
ncbi:MAG: hypothetical protein JO128_06380 [Alphaproteobacteria bacterium]|nr:hypothetical protein [Alphaproteobacteria bacterium]